MNSLSRVRNRHFIWSPILLSLYLLVATLFSGQPAILTINPSDRRAVLNFYLAYYSPQPGIKVGWTGNRSACSPGTTTKEFRNAVLRRVNYFRAMAGVPRIVSFDEDYTHKAQAAALLMSVNNTLSHEPTSNWTCYSRDGAAGAGNSNMHLGINGWDAITDYMRDPGIDNQSLRHRRWILYPQTQQMGTGDLPASSGYAAANALWVIDSHFWDARPATRDGYVAWPPPGYVPYPVVFARWSFSYPQANFSSATVTMSVGGVPLSVAVAPVVDAYGENTLVWIPMNLRDWNHWPKPQADTAYRVHIQNVIIDGRRQEFTYEVIVFDPEA